MTKITNLKNIAKIWKNIEKLPNEQVVSGGIVGHFLIEKTCSMTRYKWQGRHRRLFLFDDNKIKMARGAIH